MEEESEKNLLPMQESVEVEPNEQKEESANNETLLPENESAEKTNEEKRASPKSRFFKLFERKKISSSENLECPLKEQEAKPSRTRPNFSGFLNKFRRGKCKGEIFFLSLASCIIKLTL